ncbi:MAG: cobalt ECF transporter T component CbiQ [Archaeoglobaceae archaeon]
MHVLLERTLKNTSSYFQNFFIHEYKAEGLIYEIDARVKFVSTIVFVLLAVSTFEPIKLLFLLFSLLAILKILGLSLKKLFQRIWLFATFSFIVVSPFLLSNPQYSFLFTLRVLISLIAVQMLVMSTNFYDLCSALRSLRVPETFVHALWIAYRYTILLFQDIINILLARESRRVAKTSHGEIWRKGGEAVGLFFLRSIERSERLQLAMISRGERIVAQRAKLGFLEISYIAIVAFIVLWWISL